MYSQHIHASKYYLQHNHHLHVAAMLSREREVVEPYHVGDGEAPHR